MKTNQRLIFSLLAAGAVLPAAGLFAQEPAATTAPAAAAAHPARESMHERLESLTPEERQKLKTARETALQDPTVKAAEATKTTDRRGYNKTLHEAMLKADPSIQPILEKMRAEHHKH